MRRLQALALSGGVERKCVALAPISKSVRRHGGDGLFLREAPQRGVRHVGLVGPDDVGSLVADADLREKLGHFAERNGDAEGNETPERSIRLSTPLSRYAQSVRGASAAATDLILGEIGM